MKNNYTKNPFQQHEESIWKHDSWQAEFSNDALAASFIEMINFVIDFYETYKSINDGIDPNLVQTAENILAKLNLRA